MENRVYYGEYSLKHWIDLILKKNIILPEYQRYFVWEEDDVRNLIKAFKDKLFIPPVTIGAFKIEGANQNLILDGQQRLTSILLAFLGLFPDKSEYKKTIEKFADENDDENDENDQLDNIFEWKFNLLIERGNNKQSILEQIIEGNYKKVDFQIDDRFLETTFLGFSYLVPYISNEKQQQKYYSSVFRNINIQGKPLLPQESRDSLYFLDNDLKQFFKPEFCNLFTVKNSSGISKIDFVRYLSLLSQYKKDQSANNVARSYKPQMEKYYEDYIYSVIDDNNSKYGKFTEIFPDKKYDESFSKLHEALNSIDVPKQFQSIIELDMYFFGIIYIIVFEKKIIDITKKDELKQKIESKISDFKRDGSHTRAPSNLGHLRSRISSSIEIYQQYAS
ncbi:DUF262 domain-containing protein [Emticicia sp. TH156]|uniref:DUF262 domain-containing protein n=1 Tax=Emticicia sp. TH156 TaxID=2067454 RepID=UPI000C787C01|nr:DUF262 domain-containing protein [Emticicia sp. TH156]PLK44971.1 hypothetical protein C0V77_06915 [Emticicia sp. TH156]